MPTPDNDQHTAQQSSRRVLLRIAAAVPMSTLMFGSAFAQEFPSRAIRLVVPFPPGGPTDGISRLAGEGLAAKLGQPVTVMNKAGAAGGIASEFVANEAADGYTLLVAGQGQMFINKALGRKMGYDPDTDFKFLGMLGAFPNVLVVNPDVIPAQSLKEFLEMARQKPGMLSYGSNGIGSLAHLTTEVLAEAAKVKFLHVPYQGAAPMMTDLLSGRIGFSVTGASGVLGFIKQGKLRALAVSTGKRFAELPDVPTLVESGFASLEVPVWFGAYVASATPAPVLAKLRTALGEVLGSSQYESSLAKLAAQSMNISADSAQTQFQSEKKMWVDAVERTGAKEN